MKQSDFWDKTVVVYWTQVSEVAAGDLERMDSYLDAREHERAARFHFAKDRARFVIGRFLARRALEFELSARPRPLEFVFNERLRPVLVDGDGFNFSITHAGDLVAVAIAKNMRVGIDIEHVERKINLMDLAERILSAADFENFSALPQDEKVAAFFRVWTRKEAYLKATGEGITDALKEISVSFGAEEISSITDARDREGSPKWKLHSLALADGHEACVAFDSERKITPKQIRYPHLKND